MAEIILITRGTHVKTTSINFHIKWNNTFHKTVLDVKNYTIKKILEDVGIISPFF